MTRYFPQDEYESRWDRVFKEMRSRGFETAVVFGRGGSLHAMMSEHSTDAFDVATTPGAVLSRYLNASRVAS